LVPAGLLHANIFNGTVAVDGEGQHGFSPACGAHGRIDFKKIPVAADLASNGFYIPTVARGEIAAALSLSGRQESDG